jgi:hypothetical protein
MSLQPRPPGLSGLTGALTAGLVLAIAGCSNIAPLGPDPAPSFPPARTLGSPISMQIMRSQPPTPAGTCPARSVDLVGLQPNVPRASVSSSRRSLIGTGSPAVPTATSAPTPPPPGAQPAGVACYQLIGTPVTITSAAVSAVAAKQNQPGPAWYAFVVAFPNGKVPALTALIRRAYDSGDALGLSVGGQLWQAAQPRSKFVALRAEQVNLLSRSQAVRLHRMLVPSG